MRWRNAFRDPKSAERDWARDCHSFASLIFRLQGTFSRREQFSGMHDEQEQGKSHERKSYLHRFAVPDPGKYK
jgi:hypothetical protein